jgi:hypothetical protein
VKIKSISEKILEVERTLDVTQFTFRGTPIWPVIRMSMYLSSKGSVSSNIGGVSLWRRSLFLLNGFIQWCKWLVRYVPTAETFCLTSSHYKVTENGERHDRILEPFLDWMNTRNETFVVAEFTNTYQYKDTLPYQSRVLKIQPLIFLLSVWWRITFRLTARSKISGDIQKLNRLLNELEIRFQLNKSFEWKIYLLLRQSELFESFLRITKAKRVLVVCYYDFKSLALTWAANKRGIPAMDLQHGVQGPRHLAYSKWPSVTNYFVPSHFWVWDEYSAHTIAEWKRDADNILLGCNRWFMDRVKEKTSNILLFTAQPLDEPIPSLLIDAIRSYQGIRQWYIRLHPYQMQQLPQFEKRFRDEGLLEKVNIRDASTKPLTEVLSMTHLHMTYFSSVAVEAAYYNIPTIFLDHRGEEVFGNSLPPNLLYSVTHEMPLPEYLTMFEARHSDLDKNAVDALRKRFEILNKFFA